MDRGVQSSCAHLVIPSVSTQDSGLILLTGGDTEALRWEVPGWSWNWKALQSGCPASLWLCSPSIGRMSFYQRIAKDLCEPRNEAFGVSHDFVIQNNSGWDMGCLRWGTVGISLRLFRLPQGWLLPCHEPPLEPPLPDLQAMLLSLSFPCGQPSPNPPAIVCFPTLSSSSLTGCGTGRVWGGGVPPGSPACLGPGWASCALSTGPGEGTHTQYVATRCWLCTHLLGSHFAHLLNGDDSTDHI